LNSGPSSWATPPAPLFCRVFRDTVSRSKLLAQADFEPWSSWSLPPE
jgi:hypothetical protein